MFNAVPYVINKLTYFFRVRLFLFLGAAVDLLRRLRDGFLAFLLVDFRCLRPPVTGILRYINVKVYKY